MTIMFSMRIVICVSTPQEPHDMLWMGPLYRVPCIGERVTIPTREGPRTYKVARVTTDVKDEVYTVAVSKVKSPYED